MQSLEDIGNLPTNEELANVALDNITREFPYAAHHVQQSESDLLQPREMHPAFANSFDWHSSVHMHWLLTQLLDDEAKRHGAAGAWTEKAIEVLSDHLTASKLAAEAAYLRDNPTWERPYGWAWAAQLALALRDSSVPQLRALAPNAEPIADVIFELTDTWLSRASAPVRHGLHTNTAFGLRRIRTVAKAFGRSELVEAIDTAARGSFVQDRAWSFQHERSGQDFLSPGLCEADLMLDVLDESELRGWLPAFLSELTPDSEVLRPLAVLDPADGYQAHLYGLGLTVAASLSRIVEALNHINDTKHAAELQRAIPKLMKPGLTAAVSDEYMSSHWIATFAWEALRQIEANASASRSQEK